MTISYLSNHYLGSPMELFDGLTCIGFTEYEAKVYLALLRESPATGYQVSKTSGVPRSMVYDALRRLHARGAVLEAVERRATLYRPLPPQMLLDRYKTEQLALIEELQDGLVKRFNTAEESRVWSISGKPAIHTYASQMIQEARSEIMQVLTDEDLLVLNTELHEAHKRGIAINTLVIGEGSLDFGRSVRHPPLESELQELTGTLLVVVDSEEALIADMLKDPVATVTSNRNLVLIARQFVWMELFTQRIYARLGTDLLERLEAEDRKIFESLEK